VGVGPAVEGDLDPRPGVELADRPDAVVREVTGQEEDGLHRIESR
jgi:hypothetical protein